MTPGNILWLYDAKQRWRKIIRPAASNNSGASGETFRTGRGLVCKLYRPGWLKTHGRDSFMRVAMMTYQRPDVSGMEEQPFAWPVGLLFDAKVASETHFVGFAMREIRQLRNIEDLATADMLGRHRMTERRRLAVCRDIARAVAAAHAHGLVVGDINPRNVVVSALNGRVSLIDCDSFQFHHKDRTFHCNVGTVDFSSASCLERLKNHGNAFAGFERTAADDCHALAVLIFMALMGGRHPYDARESGIAAASRRQSIMRRIYPYAVTSIAEPPTAGEKARYDALPQPVRMALEDAFVRERPPQAAEWADVLDEVIEARTRTWLKRIGIGAAIAALLGAFAASAVLSPAEEGAPPPRPPANYSSSSAS